MRIIEDRRVVEDRYRCVADGEPLPSEGDVFVTLERWIAERRTLSRRRGRLGLRVPGDVHLDRLAAELTGVAAVAVEIPKFTDGRAYSTARLLRERYGFRGRLRAVGHVLRDQLFYLARCGFDSFELTGRGSLEEALGAFLELSVTYQPAADEALPLWRRRRWAGRVAPPRSAGGGAGG